MSCNENIMKLITKSECIEIIRKASKYGDVRLNDYKISSASENVIGFLGEYYTLTVIATNQNEYFKEYSFFLKSLPIQNIQQKQVIERIGVFKKEISLYKTLFKEMEPYCTTKWHPNYYMSRPDILVLEDLFQSGYRHIGESVIFSEDHLKIALKCFASMHSNSIVFEKKTGINIDEKFQEDLFEPSIITNCPWFECGLQGIAKIASTHPKYQTSEYKAFVSNKLFKKMNRMYELVKPTNEFLNVFCHRDAWEKNIFFKYEESEESSKPIDCILVDFQIARYQPPAIDILFFLFLNISIKCEYRAKLLEDCLEFYYKSLQESTSKMDVNLEKIFTWNDFKASCDHFKLVPYVLNAIYAPLINLPKGLLLDLQTHDAEIYHFYMESDRIDLIFNVCEMSQRYKKAVYFAVEELVDYLISDKM